MPIAFPLIFLYIISLMVNFTEMIANIVSSMKSFQTRWEGVDDDDIDTYIYGFLKRNTNKYIADVKRTYVGTRKVNF